MALRRLTVLSRLPGFGVMRNVRDMRCLVLFGSCMLATVSPRLMAGDAALLAKSVEGLPTSRVEEQIKKAVLEWALEDAAVAREAGFEQHADAVLRDVETMLPKAPVQAREAPGHLFPVIPKPSENPLFLDALKRQERLISGDERYSKTDSSAHVADERGWIYPRLTAEALELVRALCHPQSQLAADARLVVPIFRRFAEVYESLEPGSKNLADFGCSDGLAEMYLLMRAVYPELIPPSRKVAWEKAIEVNTGAVFAKYGPVFAAGHAEDGYPNAHFRYINALLFGGLVLDRPDFLKSAEDGLRLMEKCLFPDGGYCYIGTQNEVLTYHGINILAAARYWQVTGSELAKSLVTGSRWYYPLSIEPPGVAEYSTSPCWKHYWNAVNASDAALVVAGLSGDPHNHRIARMNNAKGDLFLAGFYRDDIAALASPDRYLVHDRNIEGARGRFGPFSFAVTGRDYKDDLRGKSTYVGCMMLDSAAGAKNAWPLNAALDSVGCEVRVKPFDVEKDTVGKVTTLDKSLLALSQRETNTTITAKDFASITTVYSLSAYGSAATRWQGSQQWICTPQRMVGLISLRALSEQKAYAMRGSIVFVSGRNTWGKRKEFERVDAATLKYGALTAKIHDHDYAGIGTEYTDVFSAGPGKAGRIVLLDQAARDASQQQLITYPQDASHFFLVEIFPETSKPASRLTKHALKDGLVGIELQEEGRVLGLIHNPTKEVVRFLASMDDKAPGQLHRSGEQYRPAWIGDEGRETHEKPPEPIAAGNVNIEIPPGGHIVLQRPGQ